MLVTLGLIIRELPQAPEDRSQFFLMGHGKIVGRSLGLFLRDAAVRIKQRMQLIVIVVQGLVDTFPAFGSLGARFHHVCYIDHCLDATGAFGLCGIVPRAGIEEIAAPAEPNQQDRKRKKFNESSHSHLLTRQNDAAGHKKIIPSQHAKDKKARRGPVGCQTVTVTVLMAALTCAAISAGIESSL